MTDDNVIFSYTTQDGIDDGIFTDLSKPMRFFLREHKPEGFKFDPARIVATAGIMRLIAVGPMADVPALVPFLARHLRGDWGDVDAQDKAANDRDLAGKTGRLLSSYTHAFSTQPAPSEVKIWIITEPGVTTILLPEEY